MDAERTPARLLVVEDDASLRALLVDELEDAGHEVLAAADAESGWDALQNAAVQLVVSDLRLPGEDGMALLNRTREMAAPPGFVVVTGFGTIEQAVAAIKRGADDFLTKPLDLDHLHVAVERVLEKQWMRRRLRECEALLGEDDFHGLLGRSAPMRRLFDAVRRIAAGDGPVLVLGQSGTGKELVARALHQESPRAAGPFVAVNCAGVPSELLESEFFGHVAGAFTGAVCRRGGLFQEASGGTLFLDEIGEMPPGLQAKLLRVLEDGQVRPVGSDRSLPVDLRIVAATNRDLAAAVEGGEFRTDLYYRLETFQIVIPPLRGRGEDLELLAMRFLQRTAERLGRPVRSIEATALRALTRYPFPGNVRELANIMERAVTFCSGQEIRLEDLPERLRDGGGAIRFLPRASDDWPTLDELEAGYIERVLAHCEGNKRRAAHILGIGRRTLYRRLESNGRDLQDEAP